ncbi:hypothetical protein N7532_003956 [Penicillium argentinense]|uniref:Gfd2/YDR514C-like C-terminal domain-containing protein n=1 Tax=Penicillium argentinense TaxID=1131581 RepID=A0A9W9KFP0_9EURO|nr:uncharacterized protein N7532_003956 [Penicillium argentinense]KAJ5103427.1 hypothetical protein N7532_003956 [Penicillium argentinense]
MDNAASGEDVPLPAEEEEAPYDAAKSFAEVGIDLFSSFCPARALERVTDGHKRGHKPCEKPGEVEFWARTWHLHYLPLPPGCHSRLLLLIPLKEASDYVQGLAAKVGIDKQLLQNLTRDKGFAYQADKPGIPTPYLLGVSDSTSSMQQLFENKWQEIGARSWGQWASNFESDILKDLEAKLDACMKVEHPTKKGRNSDLMFMARINAEHLTQVQKWFGLRPKDSVLDTLVDPPDLSRPAPWLDDDSPFFVCIDFEWKEFDETQLTEIGVSILDTLDIKARHLRVAEHFRYANRKHCKGYPDKFHFGKSERVPSAKMGEWVDQFFSPPYGFRYPIGTKLPEHQCRPGRRWILVGHDMTGDIKQLVRTGSQTFKPKGISSFEQADTAQLFKVLHPETATPGLAKVLSGFNIPARHLHNGGNDAWYTLMALVRIVLEGGW